MKKYLFLTFALTFLAGFSFAQDEDTGSSASDESSMGAVAGDFTGAILFGRGVYLNLESAPSAPGWNSNWTVYNGGPYANQVDANYNDMANIIGGEARYFITDLIAVKLSGGAVLRNTPSLQNVQYFHINDNGDFRQGNDPNSDNATWIPNYGSVQAQNDVQSHFSVGGEYHFPSPRFERLKPYLGASFTYAYSRRSVYDPSVYYADIYSSGTPSGGADYTQGYFFTSSGELIYVNGYFTNDPSSPYPGGNPGNLVEDGVLVYDIGVRSAVVQGIGGHAVAGIDVYLVPGIYLGLETRPVSYFYNWNEKSPGPGLETLQAKTNTWSFFQQTFLKVGFIVGKL